MLTNTALKLLRRILGPKTKEKSPYAFGTTTLLDGITAVALTEAMLGEAAAESIRGNLATAIGQALTGLRTTAFLSATDLAAAQDLLHTAVSQHVPIVIHVGHESVHLAADSGAVVLIAANVQEAVDFTLIARKIAEVALLPVIVAQDSESIAQALQDVVLPTPALIDKFLGTPNEQITVENTAQQFLFGNQRRRNPRWHDLDRPVLLGSQLPPSVRGLSQAGASVYLRQAITTVLTTVLQEFSTLSGRNHQACSRYRLEDADLVLIAQGSAVEIAETVCDFMRGQPRLKVGVLGIRCLRPFAGCNNELTRLINPKAKICVLESLSTPLATDPPLLREVRATLHHTSILSAPYGLGGMPLCAEDVAALCREAATIKQSTVFLGVNFTVTDSPYPKRQVLLDKLRTNYPTLANYGLKAATTADLRTKGCITISLHYLIGSANDNGLMPELAALLQRLLKGGTRCQPSITKTWGNLCVDRINVASTHLKNGGELPPADVALVMADVDTPELWPINIAKGGSLILVSKLPEEALLTRIPTVARSYLEQMGVTLYRLPAHVGATERDEFLGAVCSVLIEREKIDVTKWRLLAVKDELSVTATSATGRMDYFSAGLDAVRRMNYSPPTLTLPRKGGGNLTPSLLAGEGLDGGGGRDNDTAPSFLRRPGSSDQSYDSLPRFWDQVGVLYARGDTNELAPDPYLGLGAIPAHSAALRDLSHTRVNLPVLDTTQCTSCGACWSVCPDGAWNAAILGLTPILEAGLRAAEATAVRPLLGKLATAVARQLQTTAPASAVPFSSLIETAFTGLYAQLPFPEDRKVAIAKDMEKFIATIGALPVVATETLFKTPEAQTAGSGIVLALALNTDACKGCAMCVTSCVPGALSLQPQEVPILEQLRRTATAWELLPRSNAEARTRLRTQADFATLGADLLAPGAIGILSGGDSMEPGSGARLAMRLALSLSEAQQTSVQETWVSEVQATHNQILALIRNLLADTLPTDDLEALSQRLAAIGTAPADLGTLLGQTQANAATSLNSAKLQRLVTLAKGLADLIWRLTIGRNGQGRASTALVLSMRDPANFGISFPYNPFGTAVTIDRTGDGPQLAAGILDGQLRQVTADFALLRQAKLELEHPEQAAQQSFVQTTLNWEHLTPTELERAGKLWLIGDAGLLAGHALSQLQRLLAMKLPIKILVLADLDLGIATPPGLELAATAIPDADIELSLLNLAHRNAYIAQSAASFPEHLVTTFNQMLDHTGTAILHLHAPSPRRHGFPSGRSLARTHDAVICRVFPLFRYDPRRAGVFGTRLDLDGNPPNSGRTPAHYALGEERFAALFSPLADNASNPLAIEAYLALDPSLRQQHTPFVERMSHGDKLQRLALSTDLVQVCIARYETWQMLQELAGVITPFTARVRQEIEAELTTKHQAALAMQKADYQMQLDSLESRLREETRQSLRIRLLELGGYARS